MPRFEQLEAVVREKDVLRLDVAMHDALRVDRRQHVEHRIDDGADASRGERVPRRLPGRRQRRSLEQLHHQKGGPVVVDVIVEDAYEARVLDAVGDVPFAKKARTELLGAGELGVEDLDGDAHPVAVGGRVDGPHRTDAEELVDPVFVAPERRPLAAPRALCESGERVTHGEGSSLPGLPARQVYEKIRVLLEPPRRRCGRADWAKGKAIGLGPAVAAVMGVAIARCDLM